jgi:outer membrane protein assembly factor BamA
MGKSHVIVPNSSQTKAVVRQISIEGLLAWLEKNATKLISVRETWQQFNSADVDLACNV